MFFQAFMIGLLFLVNLPEVMNGTAHYGRISTTYSTQFESASNGTAASSAAASSASSSTSSATRRMLLGASSSSASSSAATSSASSSASSSGSAYTDCYKKITKYDGALGRRLAGSGDPNPCPELDVPHWGFCRGKNICCVCACTYIISIKNTESLTNFFLSFSPILLSLLFFFIYIYRLCTTLLTIRSVVVVELRCRIHW